MNKAIELTHNDNSMGAPGAQKSGKKKRETPWMEGNEFGMKHGVYRTAFTAEERAERAEYERQLEEDLGKPSTAQRSLIRRASWLEIRLRRNERSSEDGKGEIASEHVLSWINSQRLLLCALGLDRRAKPAQNLQDYIRAKEAAATKQPEEPGGQP